MSGPAFIKWGQWAGTRRDMFPGDLCKELSLLHTQAPLHPMPFTRSAIRHAFNADVEDLFDGFEVYRARLSSKGAAHTGMDEGDAWFSLQHLPVADLLAPGLTGPQRMCRARLVWGLLALA